MATEDGPALDPLLGEVGGGVVGPGRAESAAAVWPSSVVVPGVLGENRPQVPLAGQKAEPAAQPDEDQVKQAEGHES